MLGEAVPRNDDERVTIRYEVPGLEGEQQHDVRRGFIGKIPVLETGPSASYEGRQAWVLDIRGWDGDTARYDVRPERAGPR